jgi:sensor c-di-GMP phosphodiesterase-like protein
LARRAAAERQFRRRLRQVGLTAAQDRCGNGTTLAATAIGIEKASDALALTSMGCDMGQGFLLGQPMPPERFMSLLRQRAANRAPAAAR